MELVNFLNELDQRQDISKQQRASAIRTGSYTKPRFMQDIVLTIDKALANKLTPQFLKTTLMAMAVGVMKGNYKELIIQPDKQAQPTPVAPPAPEGTPATSEQPVA